MCPGSVPGFCTEIGPEFDLSLVRSSELLWTLVGNWWIWCVVDVGPPGSIWPEPITTGLGWYGDIGCHRCSLRCVGSGFVSGGDSVRVGSAWWCQMTREMDTGFPRQRQRAHGPVAPGVVIGGPVARGGVCGSSNQRARVHRRAQPERRGDVCQDCVYTQQGSVAVLQVSGSLLIMTEHVMTEQNRHECYLGGPRTVFGYSYQTTEWLQGGSMTSPSFNLIYLKVWSHRAIVWPPAMGEVWVIVDHRGWIVRNRAMLYDVAFIKGPSTTSCRFFVMFKNQVAMPDIVVYNT